MGIRISLLVYAFKAAKASGIEINADIATGLSIPLVIVVVAYFTAKVRRKLHQK